MCIRDRRQMTGVRRGPYFDVADVNERPGRRLEGDARPVRRGSDARLACHSGGEVATDLKLPAYRLLECAVAEGVVPLEADVAQLGRARTARLSVPGGRRGGE